MNIISFFIIKVIKIYRFIISPLIGHNCRFLPTCSEYFIECLETHGLLKGFVLGSKRVFKCHPIKVLGGSSGLDLVPKKQLIRNKKLNGS